MESHKLSNCQIKMHSLKKTDLTITNIYARQENEGGQL